MTETFASIIAEHIKHQKYGKLMCDCPQKAQKLVEDAIGRTSLKKASDGCDCLDVLEKELGISND